MQSRTRWLLAIAAVLALAAAARVATLRGDGSAAALTQEILVRCEVTGEEWTTSLGRLEYELLSRSDPIDPKQGLVSPKNEGRPTAFPVDRQIWEEAIERVSAEEAARSHDR